MSREKRAQGLATWEELPFVIKHFLEGQRFTHFRKQTSLTLRHLVLYNAIFY